MEELYVVVYGNTWEQDVLDKNGKPKRTQFHVIARHIIRYLVYHRFKEISLPVLGYMEMRLFGLKRPTDHSTIINSIRITKDQLIDTPMYKKLKYYIDACYGKYNTD